MTLLDRLTVSVAAALGVGLFFGFAAIAAIGAWVLVERLGHVNTLGLFAVVSVVLGGWYGWKERG